MLASCKLRGYVHACMHDLRSDGIKPVHEWRERDDLVLTHLLLLLLPFQINRFCRVVVEQLVVRGGEIIYI